ncbi:MAG: ERAP1-like C-terminal domain-containing protein [Bifidobacterium pullorum]
MTTLARAVIWLALWDMTRDAELPAERFIETTLKLLAHETESTTFRYALSCMGTTAHHYVGVPARREDVLRRVAAELDAGERRRSRFRQPVPAHQRLPELARGRRRIRANVRDLLDSTVTLDGLDIDNDMRWALVKALASVNQIDEDGIAAELAKLDTTANREFAMGASASRSTAEGKEWAWNGTIATRA